MEKQLTPFDACAIIEGFSDGEHSEEEVLAAWQYLVNTGIVWSLQGWYGRTAADMIEDGVIAPAGG